VDLGDTIQECVEDSARWFPGKQQLPFLVLALAGEVGEVANVVKKIERGSHQLDEGLTFDLAMEIVDALTYLSVIMGHPTFSKIDWDEMYRIKRAYNESRFGPPCEEFSGGIIGNKI